MAFARIARCAGLCQTSQRVTVRLHRATTNRRLRLVSELRQSGPPSALPSASHCPKPPVISILHAVNLISLTPDKQGHATVYPADTKLCPERQLNLWCYCFCRSLPSETGKELSCEGHTIASTSVLCCTTAHFGIDCPAWEAPPIDSALNVAIPL